MNKLKYSLHHIVADKEKNEGYDLPENAFDVLVLLGDAPRATMHIPFVWLCENINKIDRHYFWNDGWVFGYYFSEREEVIDCAEAIAQLLPEKMQSATALRTIAAFQADQF